MMKYLSLLLFIGCSSFSHHRGFDFKFQNGRWMNEHHFLYSEAIKGSVTPHRESLDFYRANFKGRDLLFDRQLSQMKQELSMARSRASLTGVDLPEAFIRILTMFDEVYREQLWESHEEQNDRWLKTLRSHLREHSADIEQELSRWLQMRPEDWAFTVDVVVVANWAGAYTSRDGHIVMSSGEDKMQGLAALETLYHEALHAGPFRIVDRALVHELHEQGKEDRYQIWHALQFYTVGELVKRVLKKKGIDYLPYAAKNGMFGPDRQWGRFRTLFEQYWDPYLKGAVGMEEALKKIVAEAY